MQHLSAATVVVVVMHLPRHLISDAHEWIDEIPIVPIYDLAKIQPRDHAFDNQ